MRYVFVTVLCLAMSCGPRIDDKKPSPSNNQNNNTTRNNTVGTNNTTGNNANNQNNTTGNNSNNTVGPAGCASLSPESLNFGVVEVGRSAQASVTLENCSPDETLALQDVVLDPPFAVSLPGDTTLDPLQSLTISVIFSPTSQGSFTEEAVFATDFGDLVVALEGQTPVDETCPTAIATVTGQPGSAGTDAVTVPAETTVYLSAATSMSPDGSELFYQWTFISKPAASTAQLTPNNDVVRPTLFVDTPGTYELSLETFTADSAVACPDDRVTITAEPVGNGGRVRVDLTWDTPADVDQTDATGTDLDLHYMHPSGSWNTPPWDCFWQNIDADWGADGQATVEEDDIDGMGPERIVHESPGPRTYNVGVYYYADLHGLGESYATVQIYLDGQLSYELADQLLPTQTSFLHNIWVDWPNKAVIDSNLSVVTGFP